MKIITIEEHLGGVSIYIHPDVPLKDVQKPYYGD